MAESTNFKRQTGSHQFYYAGYINGYTVEVYERPTADCQTFSIAGICNLLALDDETILKTLKELFFHTTGKKQLLCNVKQDENYKYGDKLDRLCKDSNAIIVKQPYVSTRNSNMVLYLINIEKLTKNINL